MGCYDIEHDASLTIEQVLRPYFTEVKQALEANGQRVAPNVPVALSAVTGMFEHRQEYSSEELKDAYGPDKEALNAAKD